VSDKAEEMEKLVSFHNARLSRQARWSRLMSGIEFSRCSVASPGSSAGAAASEARPLMDDLDETMVEFPDGTESIPPSIESQLSISFSIPAVIWLRPSAVDAPSSESISSSRLKSLS